MPTDRLTISEKILAAASEKWKEQTFTAEDLVVAAWNAFPDAFGLAGYADQFPDSNRVLTHIMGAKGLREKGWIRALGKKNYTLTHLGLEAAAELQGGDSGELRGQIERSRLDRLEQLVTSNAYRKFRQGEADAILFRDACAFWGITPRSLNEQLVTRLEELDLLLSQARDITATGSVISIPTQRIQGIDDDIIDGLSSLNDHILHRFEDELSFIRKRRRTYGKLRR